MIEIAEKEGRVTIRLPEEFSYQLYREFREVYLHRKQVSIYDIDFALVNRIDSSALGMLLLMYSHCKEQGTRIRLLRCNPRITKILTCATIDSLFEIV
ncbi:MAG: STAS domain-containing protein [Magnetococcales bacterium]|nr:STAS domain-containing protein [Magnetococcales bacterium]